MESKSNYTIIGLAVLVLTIGLLSAGLWLSVGFDKKTYDTYLVYMTEPAAGLNDESPIKYNGVRVGYISDIELNPMDPQKVKLVLQIEQGIPITMSTRASLISQGITGSTYLGLTAKDASLIPLQKNPKDPYPVIPYKPSFYYKLEKSINELSDQMRVIFNAKNTRHLDSTLKNLDDITTVIAESDQAIRDTLKEFPKLMQALDVSAKKFNKMADDVSVAGAQFTDTMKTGKNSINQISQQTIPSATSLLQRLDHIAANLEFMSNQMRQNPAIIVKGVQPPNKGPGE